MHLQPSPNEHFRIHPMPTILELLKSEREAQEVEEARAPFRAVDELRSFISDEHPGPTINVTIEMCVLSVNEHDKQWRLELIDRDQETQFEELVAAYKPLDLSRRSKYVFKLTIWKHRDEALNNITYREGFSYRFEKVHSLKNLYGNPTGSLQIRQRLKVVPLPSLGFAASARGSAANRVVGDTASDAPDEDQAAAPDLVSSTMTTDPPSASRGAPTDGLPPTKVSAKRKTRKDDADEGHATTFESPSKKTRKTCAKELLFVSPSHKQ